MFRFPSFLTISLGLATAAHSFANGLQEWTNRSFGLSNDLNAVAFGNGRFVAVGHQGVALVSTDGAQWQTTNSPTSMTLRSDTYGAGIFVAVGDDGTVMTSMNGTEWVPRNSGSTGELFNVVYGGGQFVAVGRLETGSGYAGVILTSADGADWRPQDSGIRDPLYAVAYGAGMFVAVGHLSAVASADGLTWHRVPVPNYAPVYAIAYGNGRFVTAENDVYTPRQAFSVSEDATYWRSTTADTEGTAWAVTFGSGIFAAVGGLNLNFANPTNQFVVSTDGQHWTTYPLGLVPELHGIAYGAGAFVAVGLSGAIVQSGVVTQSQLTLLRASDEPFVQITLQGDEGVYRLQTSTNLATGLWSDVLLLTNAIGTVTVTNVPAPPVAQQFYRAVNQ